MHELSIALSLLDVAAEEAANQGAVRVRAIHLKLGPLAGVVREALTSAFAMACETSVCVGAELVIEEVPVRIHCERCNGERPIASLYDFVCAECGAPSAQVTQGRELEVVALEVE